MSFQICYKPCVSTKRSLSKNKVGNCVTNSRCVRSMAWAQHQISLPSYPRGCHLITDKITNVINGSIKDYSVGLCNVFIQHTSASLTINENADPDVRKDMETFLNLCVPEGSRAPYRHTDEGDDDMPAHVKSSMFGCSLNIPITNGRLNLGTWQGVWLCEHRDNGGNRRLVVTLQGEKNTK